MLKTTREQCAFDRGAQYAKACLRTGGGGRAMNPHKKDSVDFKSWNLGFDSVGVGQ